MGLVDDTRVKLLLGGFVLSLFALVGIAGFGLLAALSALGTAPAGASLVFVLLEAIVPYLIASALVGMLSFFLLVGVTIAAVQNVSMPRNDRLARVARTVERHSSEARGLGLSERFEPTTEEQIEDLKQEYVEGEITELEYESRLQELLADDEDVNDERVRGKHEWTESKQTEHEFEW
jgi:hypothetical protein